MFGFGKKKKEPEPGEPQEGEDAGAESGEEGKEKKEAEPTKLSGNASADVVKLGTEVDKIKASIESFGEVRKGLTERISNINEQVGELRAMILDRDRKFQEIELKAIKAADLVESVQPDKLMIQLQKEDAKFEALKANMEGNEAIMDNVMKEMKEMRKKLDFFRGIEEIIKLGEETRKELVEIKKVEANIHIDTDKVETIYSEIRKKFQEIDMFKDNLNEFKVVLDQNSKDSEFLKTKVSGLATKDELERLTHKVQRYIEALEEINKRSTLTKDVSQLKTILEGLK